MYSSTAVATPDVGCTNFPTLPACRTKNAFVWSTSRHVGRESETRTNFSQPEESSSPPPCGVARATTPEYSSDAATRRSTQHGTDTKPARYRAAQKYSRTPTRKKRCPTRKNKPGNAQEYSASDGQQTADSPQNGLDAVTPAGLIGPILVFVSILRN